METKTCKCCGQTKNIEEFFNNGLGVLSLCKDCMRKKQSEGHKKRKERENIEVQLAKMKDARLSEFTPRELMKELARRGYKGKLEFVKVEQIDIENF